MEVNGGASSISGVFIKSVVAKSPAERTGQLFTGDRILEIDGVDLRNAGFEKATQVIKQAGNEVMLTVQSLKNIPPVDAELKKAAGRGSGSTTDVSNADASLAPSPDPSTRRDSLMPPKVPSARLTLHSTRLCTKFKKKSGKKYFLVLRFSEAFLSISRNLKLTRLQGGTQTKL